MNRLQSWENLCEELRVTAAENLLDAVDTEFILECAQGLSPRLAVEILDTSIEPDSQAMEAQGYDAKQIQEDLDTTFPMARQLKAYWGCPAETRWQVPGKKTQEPVSLQEEAMPSGSKATNPKDQLGSRKVPFSTVPANVIGELGVALAEGGLKYGRHNWRVLGVRASVYYDALWRHLCAWWEGQDIDPDSGLPHVVKAIACLTILRDAEARGMLVDDRPPRTGLNPDSWITDLNAKVEVLCKKYPVAKRPYTEKKL